MAVRLGLRSYALPGTARDYDPESNESLADFIKRQNIGSFTLGPFEVNRWSCQRRRDAGVGRHVVPAQSDRQGLRPHGTEVSVTTETCDQAVPEGWPTPWPTH